MNIIFFSKRRGAARQFNLAHPLALGLVATLALGLLGGAFTLGMHLGQGGGARLARGDTDHWTQILSDHKQQLQERVDAMAVRLGAMNAHVIRLDALGKRLTEMADIDNREFDFDTDPPTGGPESDGEGVSAQIPDLTAMIDRLDKRVTLRDSQLSALENVILARDLKKQIHPEGRPVN